MFNVDSFHCINLDRRIDRWKESVREFEKVGLDAKRFSAFSNASFVSNPKIKKHCGLVESNRYLYRENQGKTICVFEDDVYFTINTPLQEYLDSLKLNLQMQEDWGVLFLGGHLFDDRKFLQVSKDLLQLNPPVIEKNVPKKFVGGTHAVVYSPRALKVLSRLTDEQVYACPCQDVLIQHFLMTEAGLPCYCLHPMIAYQREDFSDLENHVTRREWIKSNNEKMILHRAEHENLKTYVVNIDLQIERHVNTTKNLAKVGIYDAERFSAVVPSDIEKALNGKPSKLKLTDTERNKLDVLFHSSLFSGGECRPHLMGELANKCSFFMLFKKALANGEERVLVFEDDVEFTNNSKDLCAKEQTENLDKQFPNWGMLYLGGYVRAPQAKVNDGLYRLIDWCTGIHAVVYRESVMREFVERCFDETTATDNWFYKHIFNTRPCFMVYPAQAVQRADDRSMHMVSPELLKELEKKSDQTLRRSVLNDDRTVHVCLASIPSREKMLEKTVKSLLPQLENGILHVCLNEYENVPRFLSDPKIEVVTSKTIGNKGDANKFFWLGRVEGYYLTADDDIEYPKNYVERIVEEIEFLNRKAVVGFHGQDFHVERSHSRPFTVFNFKNDLKEDRWVHALGTGVCGFHTSTLPNMRLDDFMLPNMSDEWLALYCLNARVPMRVLAHRANYFVYNKPETSIFRSSYTKKDGSFMDTHKERNRIAQETDWRRLPNPDE